MSILFAAMAGLLPLLIAPGILFHYDITPRIAVLMLIAVIALLRPAAAEELAALTNRRTGRWLCALAFLQTLWLVISTSVSTRLWFSLLGANWRRMGLLTILALTVCTVLTAARLSLKPEGINIILRATAVAAIVASLYGIAQYFDIDPFQQAAAYHAHSGDSTIVRPPGTMGHADYFGWWLAVALFCSVGMASVETSGWRWVARAAGLLCGTAILFSGTRSAMLAVLTGFAFLLISSLRIFKFRRSHAVGGLVLAILLLGFYFSPAGARMRARVQWSATEPLGGSRPLLWRDSLRMISARPLTGFGLETFAAEFPRYQSTDLARLLPGFYQESPHNTAIDALASEGIPGLVLALGWLALGLAAWRKYGASRARDGYSSLAPALASALIGSAVAAMFSAVTAGPLIITALIISMLVAMTPEDSTARPKVRPAGVLAFSVPVALCLLAYSAMLAVSDFDLARFERNAGPGSYRLVVRTAMPGPAEDLYCSRRLLGACGALAECAGAAIEAAGRATTTADNPPNAWYNLAIFDARRNDSGSVEKSLRTAMTLAPNWFKPHWALASLLKLTGRMREAHKEAERAVFLDAGKDAEVVQTLGAFTGKTQ
jgi:O-antigen ligase